MGTKQYMNAAKDSISKQETWAYDMRQQINKT